jgi:acyl-CoA dehydrogenase
MVQRRMFNEEHHAFRESFRDFLEAEAVPFVADWEATGHVDKRFWPKAGAQGFLGFEASEELGGLGIRDFRFNAIIAEEVADSGAAGDGFAMHNDIVGPYLIEYASKEQQERWVPDFTAGKIVTAIAMSEPGAGSDLARITATGRVEGDDIVINGSKTFITNGITADLVLVLVRSGTETRGQMSLVAVEANTPGFTRGTPFHKIGRKGQDTSELFFDGCRVPLTNVVGELHGAFDIVKRNLPRERLSIAITGVASARRALRLGLEQANQRSTFGKPLAQHQTVLHKLASIHTAVEVAQSHIDNCVIALNSGALSPEDAAGAKYWATDLESSVIDDVLQLFGGYGYMEEYPIARMWRDSRVQRIYGGANEIMKEIVGRALVS